MTTSDFLFYIIYLPHPLPRIVRLQSLLQPATCAALFRLGRFHLKIPLVWISFVQSL